MKKILALIGITSTLALGAVDASSLNLAPLPEQAADIAGNRVSVKQTGNIVETTLPWKDQPGIKVKYDMGTTTVAENIADKRDAQVVTELVDFGDGGFKVDIVLTKKPKTNTFCYEIEGAENYDFFYQPALTQEEIDDGAERPEDIVGSYAVYHKSLKNNEYQTGKVMHIPRPQVWEIDDKASTTVWAELSYTEPNLCVTVDQGYLNKANYPVRVDPTFGYTTAGVSGIVNDDDVNGTKFVLGEGGTVSKLTINNRIAVDNSDFQSQTNGAIYDTSNNFIASTTEVTVSGNTYTWRDYTFTTPVELTAGTYWLVMAGDDVDADQSVLAYDSDASVVSGRQQSVGTYPIFPDPYVPGTDFDWKFSIYATYTATVGGEATTTPRITLEGDVGLEGDLIIQ